MKPVQPESTPAGQKNIFSSLASTTPAVPPPAGGKSASGFSFGPPAGTKSLFGAPSLASTSGTSTPGTSIFANQKAEPTTNLFAKPVTKTLDTFGEDPQPASKGSVPTTAFAPAQEIPKAPVFFGNLANSPKANPGSNQLAPSKTSGSLFGATPTVPSGGAVPTGPTLGTSSAGEGQQVKPTNNIFGSVSTPSYGRQDEKNDPSGATAQSRSLFGQPTQSSTSDLFKASTIFTKPASGNGPAGGTSVDSSGSQPSKAAPASNLIGAAANTQLDSSGSKILQVDEISKSSNTLFGQNTIPPQASNLFKKPDQPASRLSQGKGLFGQSSLPSQTPSHPQALGKIVEPKIGGADTKTLPTGPPVDKPISLFGNMGMSAKSSDADKSKGLLEQSADHSTGQPKSLNLFGGPSVSTIPKPASESLFPSPSTGTSNVSAVPAPSLLGVKADTSSARASGSSSLFPSSGGQGTPSLQQTTEKPPPSGSVKAQVEAAPTPSIERSSMFTKPPSASSASKQDDQNATGKNEAADKGKITTSGVPSTLGASTSGPPPPPQSRLKNKTMDEIITRWAADLTKYQKEFRDQAEKIAGWDRLLVDNGEKIHKLYLQTFEADRASSEVDRQLTLVEGQQDELSAWLDRYEGDVDEMMRAQVANQGGDGVQGPDAERERTYHTAGRISDSLEMMSQDLTAMIQEINNSSAAISQTANQADDPLSQVVRILNSHLLQLQDIDQGTAFLQTKVEAAKRERDTAGKKINGFSGPLAEQAEAADDFYKSYTRSLRRR